MVLAYKPPVWGIVLQQPKRMKTAGHDEDLQWVLLKPDQPVAWEQREVRVPQASEARAHVQGHSLATLPCEWCVLGLSITGFFKDCYLTPLGGPGQPVLWASSSPVTESLLSLLSLLLIVAASLLPLK